MKCEVCGKVYNRFLGDRFWSGTYETPEGRKETLCDNCHRTLVREVPI